MGDFNPVPRLLQPLGHIFRNHHRTMLASGAAEGDCQITFAFVDVVRQKVNQQVGDALDKFVRLRERKNVFCDLRIAPGQRPEFRDEMRVRQEADIKNQVSVIGNTVPEHEADARNQNISALFFFLKQLVNVRAQLMNVELRSVDHQVSNGANGTQAAALGGE